jgi:hypothetical protein
MTGAIFIVWLSVLTSITVQALTMQAFDWHRMALRITGVEQLGQVRLVMPKPGKSFSTMIGPGRQSRSSHFPAAPL